MIVKALPSTGFTNDEKDQIVIDLLSLKKPQIAAFLERVSLPRSGTKEEIRSRIEKALEDRALSLWQLIDYLDEVVPWGKQHVFLYSGPRDSISSWKDSAWFANVLKEHRLAKYLNARLPLALPDKMRVSSILHDGSRVRVTAIKKREWWERNEEYDDTAVTDEGDDVSLRAFVHRVSRSLVAFEWDLISNTAFLQVSQLPTGVQYVDVAAEFFALVSGWLDITRFTLVDLRRAIKKLHELEESGHPEARSHGINYRSLQGRKMAVTSPSPADSVLGEEAIDAALGAVRESGVGHLGNFYWLSAPANGQVANPLEGEVHVVVVGTSRRINFPTPNVEPTVRHVLSRMRFHSA